MTRRKPCAMATRKIASYHKKNKLSSSCATVGENKMCIQSKAKGKWLEERVLWVSRFLVQELRTSLVRWSEDGGWVGGRRRRGREFFMGGGGRVG